MGSSGGSGGGSSSPSTAGQLPMAPRRRSWVAGMARWMMTGMLSHQSPKKTSSTCSQSR